MKIKSVTIKNYKSVKEAYLDLSDGSRPYTFIGKNGSGKSNILEAVAHIFRISASDYYRAGRSVIYRGGYSRGDYGGFTLQLGEGEARELDGIIAFDRATREVKFDGREDLVVYSGDREKEYPVGAYRGLIAKPAEEYASLLENFRKKLTKAEKYLLSCKPQDRGLFGIGNYSGETADDILIYLRENCDYIRQIVGFFNSLPDAMTPSEFLDRSYGLDNGIEYARGLRGASFEIKKPEVLTPAAKTYLSKEEKERVLSQHSEKYQKFSEELQGLFRGLKEAALAVSDTAARSIKDFEGYRDDHMRARSGRLKLYEKFISGVKKVVGKVYFLDYETAIGFTGKGYDQTDSVRRNLNFSGPESVIEGFLVQNKLLKDGEHLFGIGEKPDPGRLREIQNKINNELFKNILPDFDRDEVGGLEIKLSKNQNGVECKLFVKEKNGDDTPFGSTSLGRRWYICYKLIASVLKKGDFLILDEPASTLHPAATDEIRRELDGLAKNGIHVFISTHSPYMFPDDFKNIINVEMTEGGTVAHAVTGAEKSAEAMRGLGTLAAADLLFGLSDKTVLVEGKADEAAIKTFARVLGYDLARVRFHNCDGDAILQMTKLCMELKVNFVAMLDNDNRYKNDEYRERHTEYGGIIDDIIRDSGHCVFVGQGENGQIEDLFAEEDKKKYCPRARGGEQKLNPARLKKITSAADCDKRTLDNFEDVLKRLGLKKLNT